MKKILCFIDNLGSGGAQRQLVNIAILLKERGFNVEFLVYGSHDFYKHKLDKNKIIVHFVPAKSPIKRIYKITKFLLNCDADTVIAFMETPGFLACLAKAVGAKWRLINNERSAKIETFKGLRQHIFNWFERYADKKICNSNNAKSLWEKHYPQYADKLGVIYNPILMEIPQNKYIRPNDDVLNIVVAASYQELKNPIGVIEALNLLSTEERSKIHIDWYGRKEVTSGNTLIYDKATQLIKQHNLSKSIALNSETNNIYSIMAEADIIGLFSTVEGLPNAICEGMMLGKPIVMTRVSDYEILTKGNGILCDPAPESIVQAFKKALTMSQNEMDNMGKISKEKAEKLFSIESTINQWINII